MGPRIMAHYAQYITRGVGATWVSSASAWRLVLLIICRASYSACVRNVACCNERRQRSALRCAVNMCYARNVDKLNTGTIYRRSVGNNKIRLPVCFSIWPVLLRYLNDAIGAYLRLLAIIILYYAKGSTQQT